jgi:hypothetical protein
MRSAANSYIQRHFPGYALFLSGPPASSRPPGTIPNEEMETVHQAILARIDRLKELIEPLNSSTEGANTKNQARTQKIKDAH